MEPEESMRPLSRYMHDLESEEGGMQFDNVFTKGLMHKMSKIGRQSYLHFCSILSCIMEHLCLCHYTNSYLGFKCPFDTETRKIA